MVECNQSCSGITAPAANSTSHREALFQSDVHPSAGGFEWLECAGGFNNQVLLKGDAGNFRVQSQFIFCVGNKRERIAVVEQLKEGLQVVITIGSATGDVKEKVKFCRGQ